MKSQERRALARAYKESRRPMGVYRVRSTVTGRWLMGATEDLPAMLNRHRAQLRLGVHGNRALQEDWNRLGAESFAFEVLDTLEPRNAPEYDPTDDLRALEQLWQEKLREAELAGAASDPAGPGGEATRARTRR